MFWYPNLVGSTKVSHIDLGYPNSLSGPWCTSHLRLTIADLGHTSYIMPFIDKVGKCEVTMWAILTEMPLFAAIVENPLSKPFLFIYFFACVGFLLFNLVV